MTIIATKFRTARLGEQLIAKGLITQAQLQEGLEYQNQTGIMLGEALVYLGFVPATTIGPFLESLTGFPFIDLADCSIDTDVARLIPNLLPARARRFPLRNGDTIQVAMVDPLDLKAVDELRARLNRRIIPCLTFTSDLAEAINRIHDGKRKAQSVLDEIEGISLTRRRSPWTNWLAWPTMRRLSGW